jgi:glycopeptide antibiotics resistance protein
MLGITIEVLQAYIARRVSGTTGIITNTLGATLGAALARPSAVRRFLGVLSQEHSLLVTGITCAEMRLCNLCQYEKL